MVYLDLKVFGVLKEVEGLQVDLQVPGLLKKRLISQSFRVDIYIFRVDIYIFRVIP